MNEMILHIAKKILSAICICLLFSAAVIAQRPIVKSIVKSMGAAGEVVSIKGSGFGTDMTKLVVFFGASKATLLSASDQLIEANVPSGATYRTVSVTNLTSGFTSYSDEQFLLSFNGTHGFNTSNLQGQTDFDDGGGTGLYDLCMGDFDGDRKLDIVTTHNKGNLVSIFNNKSTASTIIFAKTTISLSATSLYVKCGDLNGDGKLDLVISEGNSGSQDKIFIIQNMSSGTGNFAFGSPQPIKLTGSKPVQIEIADLNRDDRPEIIFTDQGANKVGILVNQSSLSAISFSSIPISILIPEAVASKTTDGLAIGDLDGDKLPEIVTSQFQISNSNLFIVHNTSSAGSVSYSTDITKLIIGGTVKRIRIGDLDGDNQPDIAVTQLLSSGISIFLNKGSLSFSAPQGFATDAAPWGLDFGDLDGDGKTDIVVAPIVSKSLTLLNNESTPGNLSFSKTTIATTTVNKHVNIGDLNGDGKPDIAFTSIDDATWGNSSKLSVFLNKACMIPKVLSIDPLNICIGAAKKLLSTQSGGGTYVWKNTTTNTVVGGNNSYFDIPTTSSSTNKYSLTISPQAGGVSCPAASNEVTVNVSPGVATPPTFTSPISPICLGNVLNLSVTDLGYQYKWSGPDNYSGTGASANPSVSNFQVKNTGRYYLDVIAPGGCTAQQSSIIVEAIDAQDFKVSYPGSEVFCQGTKLLTVTPNPTGATYQWYKNSSTINSETNSTLVVSQTGDYYAQVSVPGCAPAKTDIPKIILASAPVPNFTAPATACMGEDVKFTDTSTTDSQASPQYIWSFGDTQTSSDQNPTHRYSNATVFNVKLSVSYQGGSCLVETAVKPITIQTAPTMIITNPDNKYDFCEGENLVLQVLGTFSSYLWSTGESTSSITVHEQGDYTVAVKAGSCTLNAERQVNTSKAEIIASGDPLEINEGESSQLTASGVLNYLWSPAEYLTNPFLANPVATPDGNTTFTVTGKDANDCAATASVAIKVRGGLITNKLSPTNFFSPNQDGKNDAWTIDRIDEFKECAVVVYDEKGVKVFSAKPYTNATGWDGTFNGKKLPDGVYYFVIRCDGEEGKPKTGSITLLH